MPGRYALLTREEVHMRVLRIGTLVAALVLLPAGVVAPGGAAPGPHLVLGPRLDGGHLPALPPSGLAVQVGDSVVLARIDGFVIGRLDGYALDGSRSQPAPGPLVLVDRSARRLLLEPRRHRLTAMATGVRVPLAYGAQLVQRRAGEGWQVVRRGLVVLRIPRGGVPVVSAARDVVTSQALAQDRNARRTAVDLRTGKKRSLPRGCVAGARQRERWFLLCLKPEAAVPTSAYLPRVVAQLGPHGWRGLLGPPRLGGGSGPSSGYYRTVAISPDGKHLLAQWSGDCERPIAMLVDTDGKHARPAASQGPSEALGFLPGGAALVAFPSQACAGTGPPPGIYRVDGTKRRLLFPLTRRVSAVAFWRSLS
jgi:hypothetical protein